MNESAATDDGCEDWTQNAWCFHPLEVMGEWRHTRDGEASLKQWKCRGVFSVKTRVLDQHSGNQSDAFCITCMRFYRFFDNNPYPQSILTDVCVFLLNSLPFPFLLLLFIHVLSNLYVFRKAGRAPEPVECSPVSDSRSRASDAWLGKPSPLGGWGEGEFHFMSFFLVHLVGSWRVLVLMMWSC